jgi:hypothetical protein
MHRPCRSLLQSGSGARAGRKLATQEHEPQHQQNSPKAGGRVVAGACECCRGGESSSPRASSVTLPP